MSLKIVNSICALLNLGEKGKLTSFFDRQIKQLKKDKDAYEHNLKNLSFNHDRTISGLQDKLDDAKEAKENAFLNVDVEELSTNSAQDNFAVEYWNRIELQAENIKYIEEQITLTIKGYEEALVEINEQIEEIQFRIDKLSATEETVTEG